MKEREKGKEGEGAMKEEIILIVNIQNTFTKTQKNSQVQFSLQIGGFAWLLKFHAKLSYWINKIS